MPTYFKESWKRRPLASSAMTVWSSLSDRLCIYDVGSAGGAPPPFSYITELINLVSFDPDQRLPSHNSETTYPVAIGPSQFGTFFLNHRPTTSSLRKANRRYTDRYDFSALQTNAHDIFEVSTTKSVTPQSLDSFVQERLCSPPDFIKLDVQGMTLEVLEGSISTLGNDIIGIEAEVEFAEHYEGQALFGDVHNFLHKHGLELFQLKNVCTWKYKTSLRPRTKPGQLQFCDIVAFKSPFNHATNAFWTRQRAAKAILLLLLYDLTDSAAAYIERFAETAILQPNEVPAFAKLTENWTGPLNFFRPHRFPALQKLITTLLNTGPKQAAGSTLLAAKKVFAKL